MNLLARSRRRRRKQLRRITMIACCISIFLCGSMLYQGHMKPYQRQADFKNYGHWILRQMLPEGQEGLSHPYLEQSGEMTTGVHIYGEAEKGEEAENTGYYLGTISEDAEEMGNLRLYEGRMPQAEDEIVMELGILNRLGYSYELGQQVTVSCGKYMDMTALILEDRQQEFATNTYTLVGTLENYTAKWANGGVLPNAVISQGAFQKLDCESTRYVFYSLKEEYQDIDAPEFVEPIMMESSDDTLVYNDYVYEHYVWGSETQSRNIMLCLMVMGICAMIYLISSYQKKRRGHYYQLRCIGATKWQVRKFSILEMLMTVLPAGLFSILLSYVLCFGITEYIAGQNQYASFFEFRFGLFARIIVAIFLTFLIALLISQFLLGNNRISIQKRTIGKLAKKRLRRQAAKGKLLHAGRIARRKDGLYFLQNLCIRIVGIAICTVVLYSMSCITKPQMLYKWQCAVLRDAGLRTNNRTMRVFKYHANYYTYDVWDMSKGFPSHLEKDLETLIGIEDISYSTHDGTHDFDWEGKEASDDGTYYGAIYYANPDSVWQDFEKQITWEGADYQKFATGEQVLLCASSSKDVEYYWSEDLVYDRSLKPGMKLRIPTKTGEVETVLAGIVDRSRILGGWNYDGDSITANGFLCAESLGKQIAKEDGISWGHTHASISFNKLSDAEATGKQLSVLAVENNLTMDSDFETLQKTYRETVRTIILYGSFCIMLLSIYLLLRTCMLRDLFLKEQEEYRKLHRIGMSRSDLLKMSLWRGIREGLSYLVALPIALGLVLYKIRKELKHEVGGKIITFFSLRLEREYPYTNQWNYVKYMLLDEIDIVYWLLFMGFMIVIIALLHRLHMKWILNEEERRHE